MDTRHTYRCPHCGSTDTTPHGHGTALVSCNNIPAGDAPLSDRHHSYDCPACTIDPTGHPVTFADQVRYETGLQGLPVADELVDLIVYGQVTA